MTRCMNLLAATPLVAALLLAIVGDASAASNRVGFVVTGLVYCDPCRAGFQTNMSTNVAGATVSVDCRPFGGGESKLKAEATTDKSGRYSIEIDQDHQEEICEVVLVKSPDPACSEIEEFRDRARVPLTNNNGIKQSLRFANPIAFFRKDPLKECGHLLRAYDIKDTSGDP